MSIKEIREKTNTDLEKEIDALKAELFDLRMQKATGQLENPQAIRTVRKNIARIKTVITERELSDQQ
ncbi:MAG: 50S ribosomal protein L29 [Erysipelothrix sp.]|jgi:large subunit ribosomal protein L29|nr:50S ribosomal protein L29 [Erysipelothrix sp.]